MAKAGFRGEKNFNAPYYQAIRDFERSMLRDFLLATDGSISDAAKMLGVSYAQVTHRVKALGGVLPGDPRREPFDPKAKINDEKHQDDDPSAEDGDDDSTESADESDGATSSADAS